MPRHSNVRADLLRRPDNLAALLNRLSAKRGDAAALRDSTMRLDGVSADGPPAQEFRALRQAVDAGNSADAARGVAFLASLPLHLFGKAWRFGSSPTELIAEPFGRFLRLVPPSRTRRLRPG
jgi:hypothetical protein